MPRLDAHDSTLGEGVAQRAGPARAAADSDGHDPRGEVDVANGQGQHSPGSRGHMQLQNQRSLDARWALLYQPLQVWPGSRLAPAAVANGWAGLRWQLRRDRRDPRFPLHGVNHLAQQGEACASPSPREPLEVAVRGSAQPLPSEPGIINVRQDDVAIGLDEPARAVAGLPEARCITV